MVHSIKITDPSKSNFKYITLPDSENTDGYEDGLQLEESEFKFEKGINIIVGANGSGKSTLLNAIKSYMFYNPIKLRSDISYKNIMDINNINKFSTDFSEGEYPDGISVYADYTACVFAPFFIESSDKTDSDRYTLSSTHGLSHMMSDSACSSGESRLLAINVLMESMFGNRYSPEMNFEALAKKDNRRSDQVYQYIKKHHIPSHTDSKAKIFTILLDEIDANLDVMGCAKVEPFLTMSRPDTQVIAIIHNVGLIARLLKRKDININWIEMSPNYIQQVQDFING